MEPVVRLATSIESQNVVYLCSLVQFHPDISRLQLFSSSQDCGIRLWDLSSSKCVCVLQSHYSAVTSLSFSPDGDTMVRYCTHLQCLRFFTSIVHLSSAQCNCVPIFICSSGRDKICTVWDLKTKKAKRAVPVYEVGLWKQCTENWKILITCLWF